MLKYPIPVIKASVLLVLKLYTLLHFFGKIT